MLRRLVRTVAETALVQLPSRVGPGDRLVLAYHNVVPMSWRGGGDRSLHLPAAQFEAQLDLLQRDFDVVPLLELLHGTDARTTRVAITFDDAYASALQLGVAACVRRQLPCTVFVAPALLGTVPVWDQRAAAGRWTGQDRAAFLSRERGRGTPPPVESEDGEDRDGRQDDVLTIASRDAIAHGSERWGTLVTFGNHTYSHPNLAELTSEEVGEELHRCDQWLRTHVAAQHVPVVAYPYGLSPVEPEIAVPSPAAASGLLVSGGWMPAGRTFAAHAIPRWNVPAGISLNGFRLRLRGRMFGG